MKKIFALLIVAAMIFTLVSCADSKYAGKYTAEVFGVTVELELKSGGSASITVSGEETTGKWSSKGNKITLKDSESPAEGTASEDGKTITFDDFGGLGEVVFEKAN